MSSWKTIDPHMYADLQILAYSVENWTQLFVFVYRVHFIYTVYLNDMTWKIWFKDIECIYMQMKCTLSTFIRLIGDTAHCCHSSEAAYKIPYCAVGNMEWQTAHKLPFWNSIIDEYYCVGVSIYPENSVLQLYCLKRLSYLHLGVMTFKSKYGNDEEWDHF